MYILGFLKFLKREKKKEEFDELDLPPAPPPLEGFHDMEMPEFPEMEMEKISSPVEEHKFDFPKEEQASDMQAQPTASMMSISAPSNQSVSAISAPVQPALEEKPEYSKYAKEELHEETTTDAYPKIHRRLFTHERMALRERPTAKTIYIKVDKFKLTLGSINIIRSDLRKSEEALLKLENIRTSKDKAFEKMKSSLDDLQNKFIFVDKTLFKGD